MAQPAVKVVGLAELRKELRKLDDPKAWTKELGRANKDIARKAQAWSSAAASGMGGPFAHFSGAIRARGGVTGARLAVQPQSNATFWGARKRTGWNAGNDGRPQHPKWVGNSWDVAVAGTGPYAINNALAAHVSDIENKYGDAVDDITRRAFPS